MRKLEVTVSIEDAALHDFDRIVGGLRQAGLAVAQALPLLGVVTGRVDARHMQALGRVPGVAFVERGRVVGVLPPEIDQE